METNENKTHLTEKDVNQLLELAQEAVPPNSKLRGQGEIALTLRDLGFGPRAIARFLATHGLPVSPAAVSKYLTANPTTTKSNTPT
jgi:predicted transcriptional regulator